jgi:hypothetical protein
MLYVARTGPQSSRKWGEGVTFFEDCCWGATVTPACDTLPHLLVFALLCNIMHYSVMYNVN